jgi:hypothetical protein
MASFLFRKIWRFGDYFFLPSRAGLAVLHRHRATVRRTSGAGSGGPGKSIPISFYYRIRAKFVFSGSPR